jgi:DNA-binding NtrC family response regulator
MTSLPITPNVPGHVLVASPSPQVRQRLLHSLRSSSRRVEQATGGAEALAHLERGPWRVLYLDRCLPDLDAEELSQTVRRRFPAIEVVMLDPQNESDGTLAEEDEDSVPREAAASPKPFSVPRTSAGESAFEEPLPGMIGQASEMQPLYRMARLAAPHATTVLIKGPTGSGKELVARGIHQLSNRAARAFVVVNCAAIPETLLESELFGYSRGAFTGALQSYGGRIQAAQGGTLFLDEIGEMPLSLQPKLLRFLEHKELQRLGSTDVVRVDARVVAATNANLLALVRAGEFRDDLYYRLSTFPLEIPPLRERQDDIVLLARHFLEKHALRLPVPELSVQSVKMLRAHAWPGNVRELQNVIERALILAEDEAVIRPGHLLLSEAVIGEVR